MNLKQHQKLLMTSKNFVVIQETGGTIRVLAKKTDLLGNDFYQEVDTINLGSSASSTETAYYELFFAGVRP